MIREEPQPNKEVDHYRMVRMEQERKMQEMLKEERKKEKKKQEEELKKNLQKIEKMKIKERIFNLKKEYKNYNCPQSHKTMEIRARLPNGKKVSQTFLRSRTILFVKDYFVQLDDTGILEDLDDDDEEEEEEEENNIEINVLSGYPPKTLDENRTLEEYFGKSSGESITIKKS